MVEAAGLVSAEESDDQQRQAWLPLLTEWYTSAKDATTRSSAEWLLRQWKVDLPEVAASSESGVRTGGSKVRTTLSWSTFLPASSQWALWA